MRISPLMALLLQILGATGETTCVTLLTGWLHQSAKTTCNYSMSFGTIKQKCKMLLRRSSVASVKCIKKMHLSLSIM